MLRESVLNLEKATKLGHAAEETRKHVQDLKGNLNRTDNSRQKALIINCRYCSYTHARGKCPAYGKLYKKCCLSKKAATIINATGCNDDS